MGRNNQNSKWATHQQLNPKRTKPVAENSPSKALKNEVAAPAPVEVKTPVEVKPAPVASLEPVVEVPASPEPEKPVQDLKPLSKKKAAE